MNVTEVVKILKEIQFPPKCQCGDPICDKHVEWRMTHKTCEALKVAVDIALNEI